MNPPDKIINIYLLFNVNFVLKVFNYAKFISQTVAILSVDIDKK